ncbi:uncharacterized protein M6B38_137260 [Iris pallida]|uniref:Uncharacterized protein n=1 Tax=Iris pallida TaxID=29817 RepID=A0AAX6FEY1_IRIPA|nr:uncharacterized protein M6B38_137260 [Iris pallida]
MYNYRCTNLRSTPPPNPPLPSTHHPATQNQHQQKQPPVIITQPHTIAILAEPSTISNHHSQQQPSTIKLDMLCIVSVPPNSYSKYYKQRHAANTEPPTAAYIIDTPTMPYQNRKEEEIPNLHIRPPHTAPPTPMLPEILSGPHVNESL